MKDLLIYIKSTFKCRHFHGDIISGSEIKRKLISADTDYERYDCECTCKCGEVVMREFSFCRGGVKEFLKRGRVRD